MNPYPIPKVIGLKEITKTFLTTLESIIIDGNERAVTPIIKAKAVPSYPFSTNASAMAGFKISAYMKFSNSYQ